jgi:hypothetical protein
MADRHMSIVDAHVILRCEGKILLLRRAADTYAAGQLCLASVISKQVSPSWPPLPERHMRKPGSSWIRLACAAS